MRGDGVEFLQPHNLAEAVAARHAHPGALPIAGGTDVMVALNSGRQRPGALLDLSRVTELTAWATDGAYVRVGAGVSYTRLIEELSWRVPALAMAARTVGSPQIRNHGTVGGNLGSASPAGDCHPPLLACGALVELVSLRRSRRVPVAEFFTGVKQTVVEPDELIAAVLVPVARGPQQFSKVGTRNAMVKGVCSFAVVLDPQRGTVGTGIGSAGPTPCRAVAAGEFLAAELADRGLWDSRGVLGDATARAFGRLIAAAASPIDDVRATAAYRRHALSVIGRRALTWAWQEYARR